MCTSYVHVFHETFHRPVDMKLGLVDVAGVQFSLYLFTRQRHRRWQEREISAVPAVLISRQIKFHIHCQEWRKLEEPMHSIFLLSDDDNDGHHWCHLGWDHFLWVFIFLSLIWALVKSSHTHFTHVYESVHFSGNVSLFCMVITIHCWQKVVTYVMCTYQYTAHLVTYIKIFH